MGGFLFYQFDDEPVTVEYSEINSNLVAVGYVTKDEFSGVNDEIVAQLSNDFVSLKIIIRKNLMIIVDLGDSSFVRSCFMQMLSKYSPLNISVAKLICAFFDLLLAQRAKEIKEIEESITALEEAVLNDMAKDSFNFQLLKMKKALLLILGFYRELLSVCDLLCENENEIISEDLVYIENLKCRIERAKDEVIYLQSSVVHLQEAYSSFLDLKLNRTMKIFTVITSVFFPLTVITSWYGMNFKYMPELSSRFGYPVVIALSGIIVFSLVLIGRKRKWF